METLATTIAANARVANNKKEYPAILTPEAKEFLMELHQRFHLPLQRLLAARTTRTTPSFIPETASIRTGDWKVKPVPQDLQDRRVEITGPVDRKMVINALNSGANMFMADFEDSNTPTWDNCLEGQQNLYDANRGTITYFDPRKQKSYELGPNPATLLVRPRGLHLTEANFLIEGEPIAGSLFDFGLYFFHNAKALIEKGSGPYFYLPKLEHHLEARWWNQVFVFAQAYLGIPNGTIKATVLIETIWASFQMEEILFELKDHSAGLNCGRWDYLFSFIKTFKSNPDYIFPNKEQITMASPCMDAYTELLVQTCHKRGAHAMGGMAAQIPIKNDEAANAKAIEKVRQDKIREATGGHDGTWVAHPALVAVAKEVFDEYMPNNNQIQTPRQARPITASNLLELPTGTITEQGVRSNINISILYLDSWLRGKGAAAIYHKMEDAATAEISRTQVWQWLQHEVTLDNGKKLTMDYCQELIRDEYKRIIAQYPAEQVASSKLEAAMRLVEELVTSETFIEFLTLPAYELLDN